MAVLTASSICISRSTFTRYKKCFSDSKIASRYHLASTKATCMLNLAVSPMLVQNLLEKMKSHPFSLSVDGSNDTGLEIRIFEVNSGQVVTQFLDMCTSVSSTSEALYTVINGRLSELFESANPWEMYTSVGVDNTSINIGIRNSLKTRRQSEFFSMDVPATSYIMLLKKLEVRLLGTVSLMLRSSP